MKIKNIKINSYGKIQNKNINFNDKINIIYGKNEAGKSTLLKFIINSFYGISKNKRGKDISDYEKYKPWNSQEFSGRIEYELDNKETFQVTRDFNKKNPKIYNQNMEDITKQFTINKKEGNEFFYDQTKIDESMFLSTLVSMQQEVKLDKQTQNIFVQKIANLAGTGEDNISYKKVIDKLNKKQLEEIGTERTQEKPINILRNRIREVNLLLKESAKYREEKYKLESRKDILEMIEQDEEEQYNFMKELNQIIEIEKIENEKLDLKIKMKLQTENQIKNLEEEKNERKTEKNRNEDIKKNKQFIFFSLSIIIINIINYILNKNTIIKYLLLTISILSLIYFIIKKINNEKKYKNKINNEINIIESKIELLEKNKESQVSEINEIEKNIEKNIKNLKQQLKLKYQFKINKEKLNQLINEKDLKTKMEYLQKSVNEKKLEINRIELEQKSILPKIDNIVELQEEQEKLQQDLQELEERNKCIELTKKYIENAYEKMKKTITPKFTENLSNIIKKISDNNYQKVSINDEKGLIVEMKNGEYIEAERLSMGTIDQLYLALRLSMIHELSKEHMPILLDETFAYFDDERLEKIFQYFKKELIKNQIIIFTCTNREKYILDKLEIPYQYIELN